MKLVVNLKTAKASGIAITNSLHASFERHWNSISQFIGCYTTTHLTVVGTSGSRAVCAAEEDDLTGRHRYFWIAAYFSINGVLVTIGPEW